MDVSKFAESDYLSKELVGSSNVRQMVILSGGVEDQGKYGVRLKLLVEFGGKQKYWNPNRTHVQALLQAWGSESNLWIGKKVALLVSNDKLVISPIRE